MAVWIWSVAMVRAWQSSIWQGDSYYPSLEKETSHPLTRLANPDMRLVAANDYLHFEVAEKPLPDVILDRLADLYWAERDAELAI
ncbi:MAG: hypothetical protein JSR78_00315 [Proteobacteria bacterium]|nr:hypothetical protein [Pseudomonadota bacterium]